MNGRLILGGSPPLRELGIGDAVDVYWALLWDRAGAFEQQQMKIKDDLERTINGDEIGVINEVQKMRAEMGLAPVPSAAPVVPAAQRMASQLDIAKKMREEMGLSPKVTPPSA